MSAGEAPPSKFQVVWTAFSQKQLQAFKNQAMQFDPEIRKSFAAQLRIIQRALEYVPLEWGESLTDLPHLDLKVCIGFHERLAVNYGVNTEKKVVFVRSIRMLAGHFLS